MILSPPSGNGSDFAFDRGVLDNDQLARAERANLRQGRIVVGGSHPGDIPIDGTLTVSGHAYTLIHSTDKAALFTMRNPWGRNLNVDGSADGIINIPDGLDIPLLIDLWPMPFWKEWFVFGNDIYGRTCHCMAYNAGFSLAPLCDLCLRNRMRR